MLDPAVQRYIADAGIVIAPGSREAYAAEFYSAHLRRWREMHALSAQIVASLEAWDYGTFTTLCPLHTRAAHEAGEALTCFDAVQSSEGSA